MTGRRICFLGLAASALDDDGPLEIPDDVEIWAVNEAHRGLGARIPTRLFQLHVRNWREAERRYLNSAHCDALPEGLDPDCFGRNRAHVDYLRTCGVPVYGQQVWPDIPTSIRYPFETVEAEVGIPLPPSGKKRLWATSSFGYMAALALTEHQTREIDISELILSGIELPLGTQRERLWEWPNFAYYLGMAAGLGITITLPSRGTSLLSAPHYATDGHPYPGDPDHWWAPGPAGVIWDAESSIYRLGTRVFSELVT